MRSLLWQPRQVSAPDSLRAARESPSAAKQFAAANNVTVTEQMFRTSAHTGLLLPANQLVDVVAVMAGEFVEDDALALEKVMIGDLLFVAT